MQKITIVLVGQPNVGKTSLINYLSGAHLKVGNFTGVTIEKAETSLIYENTLFEIIDLPGIYALEDFTMEEKVTKDFLENQHYDLILNVLDSTNLERNLTLSTQILELQRKTIIALNMYDEAKKENITINEELLSILLGVPCITTSATQKDNQTQLLDLILKTHAQPFHPAKRIYSAPIQEALDKIANFLQTRNYEEIKTFVQTHNPNFAIKNIAFLLLSKDPKIYQFLQDCPCYAELNSFLQPILRDLQKATNESNAKSMLVFDSLSFARGVAQECVKQRSAGLLKTRKIDDLFLHKFFGIPIFLFFMFVLFELTFFIGGFLQDYLQKGMDALGELSKKLIDNPEIASLIGNGILGGVGAVISFLPLIMILYLGISLLEGTGYMARVAFLLDGIFHRFGLHGKSFIPLVTGFGCSVPAYMATRTLQNKNERLITLFIIGFMSCSARLPIYVLFIGAFFPKNYAGLALFCIYIFGAIIAVFMAKLLKLSVFRGKDEPFVMEMPKYRFPSYRIIWFSIYTKCLMYLKKAGSFILFGAILIWFASQYPKNKGAEKLHAAKIAQVQESQMEEKAKEEKILSLENEYQELSLKQSYSGKIGTFMEPLFAPMDFDWRLSVSLMTGFAAKEVVVSTLGVLYALGDSQDESSQDLQSAIKESISLPTAIAFIIFIIFYIPCFAATITFGRETNGIKSVLQLFIFTSIVAYVFAFLGFYVTTSILHFL
ncbi:ferrous iron transport protein B [Helicobacter mustelae]|uniref:Ferrous iron transport protein B n=1 Tax=Helicobacter mustelae (strain ATCC 43772 / CCUG 25715 / CIP 103759 / LMG 18044 / NCTC 12198 / R85-136P) TaxID=679897 RepID=D3UFR7_HELM1|nr:ferrous iron transport protein B [Helicobacter mustelae]CBG39338.1 ferrous iron transport protein [Helicobacter mustelae 12198]SQH70850.1 ferrous iron transport protein [Helicobacter mustelae]